MTCGNAAIADGVGVDATGQVFNSFRDVSFQDYRMTPGVGFRAIVRPNVVGRLDYGYSREGGAIFAGLDFPY